MQSDIALTSIRKSKGAGENEHFSVQGCQKGFQYKGKEGGKTQFIPKFADGPV